MYSAANEDFNIPRPTLSKSLEVPYREVPSWSPYIGNEGTVVAIGGKGYYIVAGDTRISKGYSIITRNASKIYPLTEETTLVTSGMYADFHALARTLEKKLTVYKYDNNREPDSKSVACLLSRTLYQKRFFPFYTFNLLAGFDENDNGVIYGYDAVGSYDTKNYLVQGSGQAEILPVLDCQIEGYNKINQTTDVNNAQQMLELIVDSFNSAAERDIYTGDQVEVLIKFKGKPAERRFFPLRKD